MSATLQRNQTQFKINRKTVLNNVCMTYMYVVIWIYHVAHAYHRIREMLKYFFTHRFRYYLCHHVNLKRERSIRYMYFFKMSNTIICLLINYILFTYWKVYRSWSCLHETLYLTLIIFGNLNFNQRSRHLNNVNVQYSYMY